MDLLSAFRALRRPALSIGAETFSVASVAADSPHRIGKDGNGAPVLLVRVAERVGAAPGSVVLRHVAVQHEVRCRIAGDVRGAREENVTLLRCLSGEATLREYFVRVVEIAVRELGDDPDAARVNRTIKKLVELFRAFEQPARRTVQGLWGELFIIANADNARLVARSWHRDPAEGFDFSEGGCRIEVKSFSGDARIHHFSLRQARPGPGVSVVVASLRVERATGGASILDLLEALRMRVTPEGFANLGEVVAASLGDTASGGLGLTFDQERARSSLRFFECQRIPAIEPPLPAGVLSVRVESMLDENLAMSTLEMRARSAFFSAFVPVT